MEITGTFECDLTRAFQAPILGDATRFLNGYLFQPPVTGFEDDQTWGQPGGIRYPVTGGNCFLPPGRLFTDQILERVENQRWKWAIFDFRVAALFFAEKAVGEWHVAERSPGVIDVRYRYTYFSANLAAWLLSWLYMQVQWKGMMKKAFRGIKMQAESNEKFVYGSTAP